jgi:hypothetical protein
MADRQTEWRMGERGREPEMKKKAESPEAVDIAVL